MNPFKVGDKVTCIMGDTGWKDLKGVVIEIISDSAVLVELENRTKVGVHISNLKLDAPSFINGSINGAKVHNPTNGGVTDFVFCGYAFKGQCGSGERIYVTDDDGNAKYYTNDFGECILKFKFELQPEKTMMHSVAARDGLHGRKWITINISDDALALTKHNWAAYKILETWYCEDVQT